MECLLSLEEGGLLRLEGRTIRLRPLYQFLPG